MKIARIATLIGFFAVVGCSDDPNLLGPPENVHRPARDTVERLVPRLDHAVSSHVSTRATAAELERLFSDEAKRPWNARLDGGIKYADLFVDLYAEREWRLHFVTADGLTAQGNAVIDYLESVPAEVLDPAPYHVARIHELNARLKQLPRRGYQFQIRGDEAEAAVSWLQEQPSATESDLLAVLISDPQIAPQLASDAARYRDQLRPLVATLAELEARLADGALRVARDLRHGNYQRLSWKELADRGGGKAVVYDRLTQTFEDLTGEEADPTKVLTALRPHHPQYTALLRSLERYRGFRDAGGWSAVAPFELREGGTHPRVPDLRKRLAAEGFEAGDLASDQIDETLLSAVGEYQETHQFRRGTPTPGFWRSLNIDADRRVRQIELTVEKWRKSNFRGEDDFVFVNIPDFHAEVWKDGERRMRFRVVVGNNNRVCDPDTGEWRYPNATPVQWANLDHLMLNPWWNVPPRIFEEEIAERIEDKEWLAEKGYEIWEDNGTLRARQKPGEGNALGLVKFIFPNPHNTYMHDTPHKEYFDYPVRAFSHGCVRVHEPLELAAFFMEEYEMGGRDRLERILELGSTIKLEFDEEIPVFFEYYTVQVDDEGRTLFLADPYHHDKAVLEDDPAEVVLCSPTVAEDEAENPPDDESGLEEVPDTVQHDVGP